MTAPRQEEKDKDAGEGGEPEDGVGAWLRAKRRLKDARDDGSSAKLQHILCYVDSALKHSGLGINNDYEVKVQTFSYNIHVR